MADLTSSRFDTYRFAPDTVSVIVVMKLPVTDG